MQVVYVCDKGGRTGRTRYVRMLCLLTYELILNCEIAIISRERVAGISFLVGSVGNCQHPIFYSLSLLSHRTKTQSDIGT